MKKLFLILSFITIGLISTAQTQVGSFTGDLYLLDNGTVAYKAIIGDTTYVTYAYKGYTIGRTYLNARKDSSSFFQELEGERYELTRVQEKLNGLKADSLSMLQIMDLFD